MHSDSETVHSCCYKTTISGSIWETISVPGEGRQTVYPRALSCSDTVKRTVTCSCRFIYADDICCALQAETFFEIECTLTADLAHLAKYCQLWCQKPSTSKTVTNVFHLQNNRSRCELNVHMNGQRLKHDPYPMYLGVTLDRTLSYREHLPRSAAKLKSRNNLFAKLAGTSWGASTTTLRTSALAVCYSVAEHCYPAWARSSYTYLIDTQLHSAVRLISGCLQPTQLSWLPVLSNVAPPSLCRIAATNTHTPHTLLTALYPGLPGWAGTRKVKPIWILLKQETVSGSGITWVVFKSAPSSRQITMPAPHQSVFLQAGCPSCHPTNSVKALKAVAKAATNNMLQIIEAHPNWPLYAYIFEHPPPRLASRHSVLSDMTSVDTITQWREDWSSASVVNHTIVTDSTIRQPGFDSPWSYMVCDEPFSHRSRPM